MNARSLEGEFSKSKDRRRANKGQIIHMSLWLFFKPIARPVSRITPALSTPRPVWHLIIRSTAFFLFIPLHPDRPLFRHSKNKLDFICRRMSKQSLRSKYQSEEGGRRRQVVKAEIKRAVNTTIKDDSVS
jgi:hypothetical protein